MTQDSDNNRRNAHTKALLDEAAKWERELAEMVGRLKAFTDILVEESGGNDAPTADQGK